VILDGGGNKLPLGSQAAQDYLNSGDPVWCPATLGAPTPGAGGCSASTGDLASLFATFTALSPNVNGTIWIMQGADSSTPSLDGSGLAMSNFTLTLKGGWSGTSGDSTISGTSDFTHPISIIHWSNTVTLSNITITGAAGTGLTVSSSKN